MLPMMGSGLLWLKILRLDTPKLRLERRLPDDVEEALGDGFGGTGPPPPPSRLLRSDGAPLAPVAVQSSKFYGFSG